MNRSKSEALYNESKQYFPGGVNSPVRAFKSVEGAPLFITKGDGAYTWDADGNKFIDFCNSWGPLILGHNNPAVKGAVLEAVESGLSFGAPTVQENELGDLILNNHKYFDKIRFVSSGTEAVMSAIRLARGYTGRDKIIKFAGCYHGHFDSLLVEAGSGLATFGTSSSAGVPEAFAKETVVMPLNDKEAVRAAFKNYPGEIACIILEPIPANNGLLLQDQEYLDFLREICTENGTLLIFDEVISGFRIGFEGAAAYYNIQPDIMTYGKIVGGGMPVGIYAASNEIMSHISPDGGVYQAGTLSGNPVAMAAGLAQLKECLKPGFYEGMTAKTEKLVNTINTYAADKGYNYKLTTIGSIFWGAFTTESIQSADKIDGSSMSKFTVLHKELLNRGVYLAPSGYEVGFVSEAHSDNDIENTIQAFKEALDITLG